MSAQLLTDREGLRIAAEIERRGLSFYERARKVAGSSAVRALLDELIIDERAHLAEFTRLYEAHGAGNDAAYDLETSLYLSAVAGDIAFPGGLSILAKDDGLESVVSILNESIASEKDSILFYTALVEKMGHGNAQDIFREIIRQERWHLSRLQQLLREEINP